jgi:hypothetical protein
VSAALDALRAAAAAGVRVTVIRGSLELEASTEPPAALVDALARHKADIIALLDPAAGVERAPSNVTTAARDDSIPRSWAEALARLSRQRRPPDVTNRDWDQLQSNFTAFCERWAGQASTMGWQPANLLGWNPTYPYTPIAKLLGVAWKINCAEVVEVRQDAIVIERRGCRFALPRHWQM